MSSVTDVAALVLAAIAVGYLVVALLFPEKF